MEIVYSVYDVMLYLLIYGLAGWVIEVCVQAFVNRRLASRGFLSLPLSLRFGMAAVAAMLILPTLRDNLLLAYLMCLIIWRVVCSLNLFFVRRAGRVEGTDMPLASDWQDVLASAVAAGVLLTGELVVHPLVHAVRLLIPEPVVRAAAVAGAALVFLDLLYVVHFLRTRKTTPRQDAQMDASDKLEERICSGIERRLERAYPGILSGRKDESGPVFAQGVCLDKLLWVFLVSSFLGALIEMVYCRLMGGVWMNRSSVLYGAFSFVWGFGAVLLTITLQHVADKPIWYAFGVGFFVGGAYEYGCSVFTERAFGMVFWDYSGIPLNIGGRTNALYCVFWGALAVLWIKALYPLMSRGIERIPLLPGKILTWTLAFAMACNGILTCAAMIRHSGRQSDPGEPNAITQFLDTRYDDAWMEERWPNMAFVGAIALDAPAGEMP